MTKTLNLDEDVLDAAKAQSAAPAKSWAGLYLKWHVAGLRTEMQVAINGKMGFL